MLHSIRTAAFATASAAIVLGAVSFTAQAKEASAVAAGFGQSGQAAAEETTAPTQQTAEVVTGGFASDTDAGTDDVLVDLTFTLINASIVDIHYVFVSPETSDNWGDDQLGQHILPSGYEIDLPVYGELDECFYDIQVISSYGESLEFWGVDLCEVTEVEVY